MTQLKPPPPILDAELSSFLLGVFNTVRNIPSSDVPDSATDNGTFGQMALDSSYLYVCTDTDTWKSISLYPYAAASYATLTGTETLTNKTLTAPTINSATINSSTLYAPSVGLGVSGVDYSLTFNGYNNDGIITWMDDEDYLASDKGLYITGISTIGDGGTTDYSKFEADGTLEFNGAATVWKDINIGSAMLSKPAASQPDEVQFVDEDGANTGIYTLGFAIGQKVSGIFEMQHDYKEGSDFTFHVHWQGIAAPSDTDNVQWRLTYTLLRDSTTLDAVTTVDSADTAIDTRYNSYRTDVVVIDGSTAGNNGTSVLIEDQFLFTLERVAATGAVYLGDAVVATVGVHYEVDTIGSRLITTK